MTIKNQNENHSLSYLVFTHLMLLSASFFWGLNPMVMKMGLAELNPFPFNTLRLFFGVVLAVPFIFITRRWEPVRKKDLPQFLIASIAGFFLFQFCYSLGVDAASASVAAIILGTLPINVALITWLFRIENLNRLKIIGIAATFTGVIFIALGKESGLDVQGTYLWGVILLVIGEIGYATFTVSIKPLTHRYSSNQIVTIVMIVSLVLFSLYSLPVYGIRIYRDLSPLTWGSAVFSGIFALVLGNILWSIGIRRIGSTNTSVYGNLQPVFGVGAAILILHERLSLFQILGAFIILAGVALVNKRRKAQADGKSDMNS